MNITSIKHNYVKTLASARIVLVLWARCRLNQVMDAHEKRRHPRKDIFTAALIVLADEGFLTEVWDLSQGGARLGKPRKWVGAERSTVRVFFMLDQETVISLSGTVVRVGEDHVGVQFDPGQEARVNQLMYEARFLEVQA